MTPYERKETMKLNQIVNLAVSLPVSYALGHIVKTAVPPHEKLYGRVLVWIGAAIIVDRVTKVIADPVADSVTETIEEIRHGLKQD